MDRGPWQAYSLEGPKELDTTEQLNTAQIVVMFSTEQGVCKLTLKKYKLYLRHL